MEDQIETSINVPVGHIERLIQVTDEFVIDIKDMNPAIYEEYTGQTNEKVIANLRFLAENGVADRCLIRVPMIPEYNSENDRQNSVTALKALGFNRFDVFEYKKDINK